MIALRFAPVLALMAVSAAAQPAVVIDEASFSITRAGSAFGTESFKIVRRQGPDGLEYVAQCTRIIEGRVVKTALTVDSAGSATNYSRTATGSAPGQLSARRSPGRLTVDETGGRASTKDYLFGPGSLILDDDLLHQLYFVTWRQIGRPVAFVAPDSRTSGDATVVEVGPESVMIGKTSIPARRFTLGTGGARRDIWIDSNRRLLKVSVPAQRIEATRELPPP